MRILRLHLLEGRAISEIYEAGRLPTDGVLLVARDIFREVCDFRGPVADFLRHHAALTGPPVALLLRWLANCPRKFHRWQDRYGKVNRHNAKILCDHWIELHESYTSAPPSLTSPGVIHWKATTACAELGPIRASSVEGRRIREKVLTNGSSLPFFDPLSINRIQSVLSVAFYLVGAFHSLCFSHHLAWPSKFTLEAP